MYMDPGKENVWTLKSAHGHENGPDTYKRYDTTPHASSRNGFSRLYFWNKPLPISEVTCDNLYSLERLQVGERSGEFDVLLVLPFISSSRPLANTHGSSFGMPK